MESIVLNYAPSYWNKSYHGNTQIELKSFSEEYKTIQSEVKQATNNFIDINSIRRNQNIHDLGQVLLREQLLAVVNPSQKYYRVRRYVTVRKQYLPNALEYNLDHRRCGKSSLLFEKNNVTLDYNDVLLLVQVIVTTNQQIVTPSNSSDYFIDYIVTMNN